MSRFVAAAVGVVFVLGVLAVSANGQIDPRQADVRAETPDVVKIFTLKNARAEEMQRIVVELFSDQNGQQGFGGRRASRPPMRTSSDPRTNSLIVVGAQDNLTIIESLLLRLDLPTPEGDKRAEDSTVSELRKRIERLERTSRSSAGSARGFFQPNQGRSSSNAAPPSQAKPAAETKGTSIRVRARSVNGEPLELISIVAVGKQVKKGDLLASLNSAPLESAVKTQQAVVERARGQYKKSETMLKNALLQKDASEAEAVMRIELAKLDLMAFQEGTRPLQIKVLKTEVQKAKSNLEQQKRRVAVAAGNAVSVSLDTLKAELDVAVTKLEVFEKFTGRKTTSDLENAVVSAQRNLEQMRAQASANVSSAEAELVSLRAEVDLESQRMSQRREDLALCKMLAPHDGVVAAASPFHPRQGSLVRERQVVLTLVPVKKGS